LRGLLLILITGGWLAGIILNSWLSLPPPDLLTMAALCLLVTCFFWRGPFARIAGLALLCLCLGAWRYAAVSPVGDTHAVGSFIGSGKMELQGTIADEPRLESRSTLLIVAVNSVSLDSRQRSWQAVHGTIQVQAPGATFDDPYAPRYGDTIQLQGGLTAPPSYSTPEIQASMAFPRLSITNRGGNPLLVFLFQARTTLAGILMQALPQPFAALLIAIFLSLRTPALKPLIPLFTVTGTAHLLAPGGFKVTLLAGLIAGGTHWLVPRRSSQDWLLLPAQRRRGNWRRWLRTLLVVLCIVIYTFLSGGGPAAMRAGIMGILLVLAPRLERFYNVYTALALTALVMSLASPFVLWDSGFQLSFIGVLGIVLFTPFFLRPLRWLARLPLGEQIAEIIAVTLAAQVATLPIFALSFNQISLIAPLANILSVPLLSTLLSLGALICLGGLVSARLAIICGWLTWPLLWYLNAVISWCAHLRNAYLQVSNLNPALAWVYYALLGWTVELVRRLRLPRLAASEQQRARFLLPRHARLFLRGGLALLTILATGTLAQAAQPDGRLTITLLTTGNPDQGEALFIRTPDGQTALINEGADSNTLAQTLDTRLPFWQRSLSLLVLSDVNASNLAGAQDIVTRYQVERVVDAGMLHPGAAYARWRSTLDTRGLSYTQVRQGAIISLGAQVSFQVLWPPAQLHKSSNETHDNALVLRLLAPGLSMLLLDSAAQSTYVLQTLPVSVAPTYLQAAIAQATSEQGKAFPAALAGLLAQIHPALLLVTSTPTRKSKTQPAGGVSPPSPPAGSWQVLRGEQIGQVEIQCDGHGWEFNSA